MKRPFIPFLTAILAVSAAAGAACAQMPDDRDEMLRALKSRLSAMRSAHQTPASVLRQAPQVQTPNAMQPETPQNAAPATAPVPAAPGTAWQTAAPVPATGAPEAPATNDEKEDENPNIAAIKARAVRRAAARSTAAPTAGASAAKAAPQVPQPAPAQVQTPAAAQTHTPAVPQAVSAPAAPVAQTAPAAAAAPAPATALPAVAPAMPKVAVTAHAQPAQPAVAPNVSGEAESFSVVLDPGHGGKYEPARANSGDHWDPFSKTFLLPYNFGASGGGMYEHEWTLATAKKVEALLAMTQTEHGFKSFATILQRYMRDPAAKIKRVKIDTFLTRNYSAENDPNRRDPNLNAKYRLFDSPESFSGGAPSPKTALGRISYINQISPDLVICLHVNSSPNKSVRGMSAVIAPHFQFFSNINNIVTSGPAAATLQRPQLSGDKLSQIAGFISATFKRLTNVDTRTMVSDTATYFTGFRAFTNKFIGLRYVMVTWRYNTSSILSSFLLFFMRENSVYECYKRSGGPEGYGGDNFYSSQEIIRYIRQAIWASTPAPVTSRVAADEYLGKHGEPFISDWAVPLFTNAITAFVEVGYMSSARDRKLLKENQDAIAEGIAVGIYSLFAGLDAKKHPGLEPPKASAIDFSKYGRNGKSSGYFNISCEKLPF